MNKQKALSYIGSMQQLAYIRPAKYTSGRASGLHSYQVKNGDLSFNIMVDKCLDIAELTYKGVNFNFLSKPGLINRGNSDVNGEEALRSIMGGLLFTAGLENICAPCTVDGKDYPMHGRLRTTPAEHVCADAKWIEDQYHIKISGEMREAELFGENLQFRRSIRTTFPNKCIEIEDVIENQSFREETMMLLYHFNFGYPLLTEGVEIILPSKKVSARDKEISEKVSGWGVMDKPLPNEMEYVFIHELASDENGDTVAAIYNKDLEIGMKIEFNTIALPYFMEWKTVAAGDYALGLEPSNSSVYGKLYHLENDNVPKILPFEKKRIKLTLSVLEGEDDFLNIKGAISKILKS